MGLRETRLHTDHRIMLVEIRREGETCNRRYRWGRKRWPIRRSIHMTQPEQEETFNDIKGKVDRALRPMTARADWISAEK